MLQSPLSVLLLVARRYHRLLAQNLSTQSSWLSSETFSARVKTLERKVTLARQNNDRNAYAQIVKEALVVAQGRLSAGSTTSPHIISALLRIIAPFSLSGHRQRTARPAQGQYLRYMFEEFIASPNANNLQSTQSISAVLCTYTTLIEASASTKDSQSTSAVYQSAINYASSSTLLLDSTAINSLLMPVHKAYMRACISHLGDPHAALKVYENLRDEAVKNSSAYLDLGLSGWNTVLGAYVKVGMPYQAFDLFTRMKVNGIQPNLETYNRIIQAAVNASQIQLNRTKQEEMNQSTNDKPQSTHQTTRSRFSQSQIPPLKSRPMSLNSPKQYLIDAVELLHEMKQIYHVFPNQRTYHLLIYGHLQHNDIYGAFTIFNLMIADSTIQRNGSVSPFDHSTYISSTPNGIALDPQLCQVLLDTLVRVGNYSRAREFVSYIQTHHGTVVSRRMLESLIDGYAVNRQNDMNSYAWTTCITNVLLMKVLFAVMIGGSLTAEWIRRLQQTNDEEVKFSK